jgi:hypothetical protein
MLVCPRVFANQDPYGVELDSLSFDTYRIAGVHSVIDEHVRRQRKAIAPREAEQERPVVKHEFSRKPTDGSYGGRAN